jgi:hypothetical protein
MGELYYWANPVAAAPLLDHTWVTSYPFDNRENPPKKGNPAGDSYWYCWGEFHREGSGGIHHEPNGAIGQADADIDVVSKLVLPNTLPPKFPGKPAQPQDGAIAFYAVDGVCQNLANQLLYATGGPDRKPSRVADARGYQIATFFYSNYGLNVSAWNSLKEAAGEVLEPADDFSTFMHKVLGDRVSKEQLMAVAVTRKIAQLALHKVRKRVLSGELESIHILEVELAAIWLAAFFAVDAEIGHDNFFRLFPSLDIVPETAEHTLGLIDRDLLRQSFETHQAQVRP